MALVLGITGGVGTGKSTALRLLGELGAQTLSADDIARDVVAKNTPAYREIVERFGDGILRPDEQIDRPALGAVVFRDADARGALEAITHPRIIARMREQIEQFRSDPPRPDAVLAVEIPLLIECGLSSMVDRVMVVAAEQETQLSRLTTSGRASREEALARIAAQIPIAQKIAQADVVLRNDGTLESLERSVRSAWDEIRLL